MRSAKALCRPRRYQGKSAPRLAWYYSAQRRAKQGHFNQSIGETYWDHVSNEASLMKWALDEPNNEMLSVETGTDVTGSLDIKSFTQDNPTKAMQLLSHLRVEFQELFLEYYLLGKSQSFLGQVHGCIQTRIWQSLRIAEQAIGAILVLGAAPDAETLFPILKKNELDHTAYGSLTTMIMLYAKSQSYTEVAKTVRAPVPAIRKIFRPAIEKLLAAKDIKSVAVGCYLRNLTHQVSLTGSGLSKRVAKRLRRMRVQHFEAPAAMTSPLFNFNKIATLGNTPWIMLEIASEHRMAQITPLLQAQGKRIFGKTAAQIFAPVNKDGDLLLGYIFARSLRPELTYSLRQIRGITELSATRDESDRITKVITVPHSEISPLIDKEVQGSIKVAQVKVGDFVEIQTGDAAHYCGTVLRIKGLGVYVEVKFPSGRVFNVTADPTAIKLLPNTPAKQRAFWGIKHAEIDQSKP